MSVRKSLWFVLPLALAVLVVGLPDGAVAGRRERRARAAGGGSAVLPL